VPAIKSWPVGTGAQTPFSDYVLRRRLKSGTIGGHRRCRTDSDIDRWLFYLL